MHELLWRVQQLLVVVLRCVWSKLQLCNPAHMLRMVHSRLKNTSLTATLDELLLRDVCLPFMSFTSSFCFFCAALTQ